MEAAGSAVGIASLGIQICQGLISYYHDWRSYHDDISPACDKVSSLERTFALLREILGQDSLNAERTAQVRDSLLSCKDTIRALEKRCAKVQASSQPESLHERAAAVTKRALYPFKGQHARKDFRNGERRPRPTRSRSTNATPWPQLFQPRSVGESGKSSRRCGSAAERAQARLVGMAARRPVSQNHELDGRTRPNAIPCRRLPEARAWDWAMAAGP